MSISLSGVLSSLSSKPLPAGFSLKPTDSQSADPQSAEQKFLDYMKMSPAERMHAAMMSQLGISEDEFNAMDPAAQQEVEQKIQQMIQQQAEQSNDKRTGLITDISV
jgi:TPP-dependent pyruvate/acetoin dehydrogenase alpha subunit